MKNKINIKGFVYYIVGVLLLTVADQLTKMWAVSALKGKQSLVLIDNVFEFYYLENTGTAWGLMSGARIMFLILTVVILLFVTVFILFLPGTKKMLPCRITLTLLAAGAAGNFIDRLFLGYVRDFIYFKLINFPVFNVADICVTIAIICFVILAFFVYKEEDFDFIAFPKKNQDDNL
jgi:signal peptidase II